MPAGTPDFRGNSSSCTDTPPVFLAVSVVIHNNQAFYRRKSGTFAGADGRIDRQESKIYGFTDADRMRDHYKDY
jgi:hypothetical protein